MDRLKFVRIVKGKYAFFRSKETGDVALPRPIGGPEFHRKYAELLDIRERGRTPVEADRSSWSWLIDAYLASAEFAALADTTQDDYRRTCELLRAELGDQPFRFTTRGMLKAVRDDFAATPRKANKVKQMASRLFTWADENDLVPAGFNPAADLKRLKRKGGDREILDWSDAEIEWIFAAAPAHVLTPLMIFLFTGQRERDVPGMTWSQWQGDVIRVRTSKTGALLDIPCHPALKTYLERLRASRKVVAMSGEICLTEAGKPFSVNGLNGAIRRLVERVARTHAIPGNRSPHGLRYSAASRMEEGGATHAAIAEVLGHRTFRMALKYAGQRVRARSAVAAMPGGAVPKRTGNEG